jgi:hypothetical protein
MREGVSEGSGEVFGPSRLYPLSVASERSGDLSSASPAGYLALSGWFVGGGELLEESGDVQGLHCVPDKRTPRFGFVGLGGALL